MDNLQKSYREINIILDLLGSEFKKKLPIKMLKLYKEKEDKSYKPSITLEDVYNRNILKETSILLTMLYINYWTDDKEKKKYKSLLKEKKTKKTILDTPKAISPMNESTSEKIDNIIDEVNKEIEYMKKNEDDIFDNNSMEGKELIIKKEKFIFSKLIGKIGGFFGKIKNIFRK